MNEELADRIFKEFIGQANQRAGKNAEDLARYILANYGIRMIEKIATPIKIVERRKDGFVRIVYEEKVSGDIRGLIPPTGRRVLAEVKKRDRNLRKSDFEEHQRDALDDNAMYGGLSLVCWMHPNGMVILEWPIPGFEKDRASIKYDDAKKIAWAMSYE